MVCVVTHTHALHMNILCLMNIGSQEAAGAAVPGGMRKHHPPPRSAADCRGNRRLRQKQGDGKHALCLRAATCRQCMHATTTTRLGCVLSQRQTAGESAGWRWDRSICAVLCLDTQCVEHHKHEERGINEGLLSQRNMRRGKSHACSVCDAPRACDAPLVFAARDLTRLQRMLYTSRVHML